MPLITTLANASARGYGGLLAAAGGGTSYESIATTTVGAGGTSTITFSSIPSTYKHLQLRGISKSSRTTAASDDWILGSFNSDTTYTNYDNHGISGSGSSAAGFATVNNSSYTGAAIGDSIFSGTGQTSVWSATVCDILDYSSTNKYKTVRTLTGSDWNGNGWLALGSSLWMSTSAINSITLTLLGGYNFVQYSSFALYGIKG